MSKETMVPHSTYELLKIDHDRLENELEQFRDSFERLRKIKVDPPVVYDAELRGLADALYWALKGLMDVGESVPVGMRWRVDEVAAMLNAGTHALKSYRDKIGVIE